MKFCWSHLLPYGKHTVGKNHNNKLKVFIPYSEPKWVWTNFWETTYRFERLSEGVSQRKSIEKGAGQRSLWISGSWRYPPPEASTHSNTPQMLGRKWTCTWISRNSTKAIEFALWGISLSVFWSGWYENLQQHRGSGDNDKALFWNTPTSEFGGRLRSQNTGPTHFPPGGLHAVRLHTKFLRP
jgi:hypothetical protein